MVSLIQTHRQNDKDLVSLRIVLVFAHCFSPVILNGKLPVSLLLASIGISVSVCVCVGVVLGVCVCGFLHYALWVLN